jgi:uncharacterized protein with PQ loop repeat
VATTTTDTIAQLLGTVATAYGVLASLSVLLQARQMLARRASCEVSGRFFASYAGGYAIWLLYGLSVGNVPLTIVDAVGVLCGGLTLAVTLSLRGSLIDPTSWSSCTAIQVSNASSERVPAAIPNAVAREELVTQQHPGSPRDSALSEMTRHSIRVLAKEPYGVGGRTHVSERARHAVLPSLSPRCWGTVAPPRHGH